MECARCGNPIYPPEWQSVAQIDEIQSILANINNKPNNCNSCLLTSNPKLEFQHYLPAIMAKLTLSEQVEDGWITVSSLQHRLAFFILSQIVHNGSFENNILFNLPHSTDIAEILYFQQQAIGFFTVKPKGTVTFPTMQTYLIPTLDTAFILPMYRRRGFGIGILNRTIQLFPSEDIGISSPISPSMLRVLKQFLENNPSYKHKLWEMIDFGDSGSRKLIYYEILRKTKE